MKKTRYIPYGYTMKNGKLVIEKTEAEVIRAIFEEYVDGASLKEIADELTKLKVPYTEKKNEWFKARIARIIENTKYLGNGEYDKIIDDELYTEAINAKSSRQVQPTIDLIAEIMAVRNRVKCGNCGSVMSRKVVKRNTIKQEWTCTNPECKCRVKIDDATLLERVMIIINRIIQNNVLLERGSGEYQPTTESMRMTNELNHELQREDPDENFIISQIIGIASEQYRGTTAQKELSEQIIKKKIRRIEIQQNFNSELFTVLVRYITLYEDGHIILHTKTDTDVGDTEGR